MMMMIAHCYSKKVKCLIGNNVNMSLHMGKSTMLISNLYFFIVVPVKF